MLFQRCDFLDLNVADNFDVLLKCGDETFYVHRLILAAASSFFRRVLQDSQTDDSIITIILTDYNYNSIREILDFLYGRKPSIEKTDILKDLEFDIFSLTWQLPQIKKCTKQHNTNNKSEEKDIKEESECIDIIPLGNGFLHEMDFQQPSDPEFGDEDFMDDPGSKTEDIFAEPRKRGRGSKLKNDKTRMTCILCNNTLDSIMALGRHIQTEHEESEIFCDKCKFKTDDVKKLYMHVYRNHKGNFLCEKCEYKTNCKSNLQKHMKVKHEDFKFECSSCDFVSNSGAYGLKKHRDSVHGAGIGYSCDQCTVSVNTKSELRAHKKESHKKQYMCDQCEYIAKNLHNLKVHKLAIHEGHKYLCDQCEYSAKTTISLTEHIKVVHKGIKKLCDQCDYVGTTIWSLRKHKDKHHEKIKVYCDKCQYSTSFKGELNHHIKIVHEGFRYYCDLCDYSSQKKIKIKRHKQSRHEIEYKPNEREDIIFKPSHQLL